MAEDLPLDLRLGKLYQNLLRLQNNAHHAPDYQKDPKYQAYRCMTDQLEREIPEIHDFYERYIECKANY